MSHRSPLRLKVKLNRAGLTLRWPAGGVVNVGIPELVASSPWLRTRYCPNSTVGLGEEVQAGSKYVRTAAGVDVNVGETVPRSMASDPYSDAIVPGWVQALNAWLHCSVAARIAASVDPMGIGGVARPPAMATLRTRGALRRM
jgi:hypothetical protein